MNLGIICPAEIALRRFMPSLNLMENVRFCGIGVCDKNEREGIESENGIEYVNLREKQYEKAKMFVDNYGGRIYTSYSDVVTSKEIDAVYIPLPPALHFKWAKAALDNGKHVLIEKPSTLSVLDTDVLVRTAHESGLALHENYMFMFHSQIDAIEKLISSGEIGDVRLYRISFGFPRRAASDFRYNKWLGGGALFDAGGYTIKYAAKLLGNTAKLVQAQVNYIDDCEVDIFGTGVMVNETGLTVQLSFGMDNEYKCEMEAWGSKGTLYTNRIFTAPTGYMPIVRIIKNGAIDEITLEPDDAFRKSICRFVSCISNEQLRKENANAILRQARYIDVFKELAGMK